MDQYIVYRLDKTDTHGNSHGINRDETWSLEKDESFPCLEDAVKYVVAMNKKFCSYDLSIMDADTETVQQRCTDSKWCHKQRYFVGKPDITLIKKKLKAEGIHIVSS